MEKLFFISGLPRSGSTLLANILCQNPDVHATGTSGLLSIVLQMRNSWDKISENQALDEISSEVKKINCLRGVIESFHRERNEPYIFDKSRGWLGHIELLEAVGFDVKILANVRPLPEILASWELLWRKTSALRQMDTEAQHYVEMQTVEARCDVWTRGTEPIGMAINRLRDAIHRGHGEKIFLINYEALTIKPQEVMEGIYDFVGAPYYDHDFDNVVQVVREHDRVYGIPDLHTIRSKVAPQPLKATNTLGAKLAAKYSGLVPWEN